MLRQGTTALVAGLAMWLVWSLTGTAQQDGGAGRVRSMNGQVLRLYNELESGTVAPAVARAQADAIIQQRARDLSALIERDPAEALRVAFPADVLSDLATAFPAARRQLESHETWEGAIEYVIEDGLDFRTHRNIRTMSVGTERLFIQFAGNEPAGLENGDVLRVTGVRAGNQLAAENGATIQSAQGRPPKPQPAPCTTQGPQSSIVLLVTMPGVAPPTNVNPFPDVWDMFFNTDGTVLSLTDFWRKNSSDAPSPATAVGTIAPGPNGYWYTLDQVYTPDQVFDIRAAAIRAADADVDFSQYRRVFILVNGLAATTWGGQGTLGCGSLTSDDGTFNASTSWMRAELFDGNIRGPHLAIHEGGHNLGLHHSNSRDFDVEALAAPGAAGVLEEYGDAFSAMGRGVGHYSAPHKFKLGWLPTQVRTITSSGSYSVQPTELAGTIKALKIRRGTDNANWLWVEYRQALDIYDAKLASFVFNPTNPLVYLDEIDSHIYSGGLIHYEDATTGNTSQLLDFTPGSREGATRVPVDWLDPPLVGSWQDAHTGLSITTSSPTSSGLRVDIAYGLGACVESNPSVAISPANPSAKRGQLVTYTVTVTNNDSPECYEKEFNLASSLPAGWPTVFSQATAVVPAASSVSVSMTKTVPANGAFATFPVDASATSGSYSATGSASVTVKPGK
jgi:M6 family metalloprotease-like protein